MRCRFGGPRGPGCWSIPSPGRPHQPRPTSATAALGSRADLALVQVWPVWAERKVADQPHGAAPITCGRPSAECPADQVARRPPGVGDSHYCFPLPVTRAGLVSVATSLAVSGAKNSACHLGHDLICLGQLVPALVGGRPGCNGADWAKRPGSRDQLLRLEMIDDRHHVRAICMSRRSQTCCWDSGRGTPLYMPARRSGEGAPSFGEPGRSSALHHCAPGRQPRRPRRSRAGTSSIDLGSMGIPAPTVVESRVELTLVGSYHW